MNDTPDPAALREIERLAETLAELRRRFGGYPRNEWSRAQKARDADFTELVGRATDALALLAAPAPQAAPSRGLVPNSERCPGCGAVFFPEGSSAFPALVARQRIIVAWLAGTRRVEASMSQPDGPASVPAAAAGPEWDALRKAAVEIYRQAVAQGASGEQAAERVIEACATDELRTWAELEAARARVAPLAARETEGEKVPAEVMFKPLYGVVPPAGRPEEDGKP